MRQLAACGTSRLWSEEDAGKSRLKRLAIQNLWMQAECGRPGADAWSTAAELLSTQASEVYHVPHRP